MKLKTFILSVLAIAALTGAAIAAQLTSASPRTFEVQTALNTLPVAVSNTIYRGSAVSATNGYAHQLVAGETFKGFAEANADNSTGADGAISVSVRHSGIVQLAVTSVAVTDEGKAVYASDGATFALTQSVTNSRIGTVHRFISTGIAMVKFNADAQSDLTSVAVLTGTFNGTASGINTNVAIITANDTNSINTAITNINFQLNELQTKLNETIKAGK